MEIGTEISQKIRSAIKAKLIELGAYVDDELPDYIMVMVANKKTQQQMTDDLCLFLASNTEKFTAWLHSLLKKLQSINTDQPPAVKDKHKHKHDKPSKHEHDKPGKQDKQDKPDKQDKSDKTKGVKRKKSHSEKVKSSDSGKHKKTPGDATAPDSVGSTKHKRHSTDAVDTMDAFSSQKRKLSTDEAEAADVSKQKKTKSADSSKGDKSEVKKAAVAPLKQEKKDKEEEKPEINIIENTDEFSEEVKVEEKKEVKKASKAAPEKAKVEKDKEVSKQKSGKVKEAAKSAEKPKVSSKHKPSSVVGSVKRKFVDEDEAEEEEEYDPLNPAVGTVASVIRGPARKSSVPKSLQANRSLLMKAVSDAEKSVADLKKDNTSSDGKSTSRPVQKVTPSDLRGRLKTAAGLQLISKSRRQETQESMKYTVDNKERSEKSSKRSKSQDKKVEPLKDLKLTVTNESISAKKKTSPKTKAPAVAPARMAKEALKDIAKNKPIVTKTIQQEEDSNESGEEEYGPPLPDSRLVRHSEDTFQVGLSPQLSENNQSDADIAESSQSDAVSDKPPSENLEELEPVTDPEIQQLLDDDDDDYDLQLNSDSPRGGRTTPKDPKFIVTLDGVDPQTYEVIPEHRPQNVQTVKPSPQYQIIPVQPIEPEIVKLEEFPKSESPLYSKITPPKIKPFNINLKDTDDEDEGEAEGEGTGEGEEEMQTEEVKQPTLLERCKFWPACANGNDCQYIHPSIPCKTFPYCKFGEKCLYIHPNCKYDAKCTRMDCPFTHATRRAGGFAPTVIHQYVPMPIQQPRMPVMPIQSSSAGDCRFYPNCRNMNCPFNHPKPCRFGVSCANKAQCRFYHPPLPTKDKMKWAAGNTAQLGVQSGRYHKEGCVNLVKKGEQDQ